MSIRPREFLFVLWDGGGTVPPVLALARRMVARGHRISVLGPHHVQGKVESAGCRFLPYRSTPDLNPQRPASKEESTSTPAATAIAAIGPYADDVREALLTMSAEAVVTDCMLFGAYVAAEAAGLPCAGVVCTIYPLPAPGLPPFGSGFSPATGPIGRIRDNVVNALLQRMWNGNLGNLNQVRARFGLPPVASIKEQMLRARKLLVLTSETFDLPTTLPPNVRYVGPQLDDVDWLPLWQSPWPNNDARPLVLVSLSTTYQAQESLLQRILLAVADVHARILVTLGPAVSPESFKSSPNAKLVSFAPHLRVLPEAALLVTHAGHGTVLGALVCGVPVVCVPMGRDQGDVAARVVHHGAGVRVSRKASPAQLRAAIMQVLQDPRYRDAAKTIAAAIARENGAVRAVEEVETLKHLSELRSQPA